jgi:hypothetical protein
MTATIVWTEEDFGVDPTGFDEFDHTQWEEKDLKVLEGICSRMILDGAYDIYYTEGLDNEPTYKQLQDRVHSFLMTLVHDTDGLDPMLVYRAICRAGKEYTGVDRNL